MTFYCKIINKKFQNTNSQNQRVCCIWQFWNCLRTKLTRPFLYLNCQNLCLTFSYYCKKFGENFFSLVLKLFTRTFSIYKNSFFAHAKLASLRNLHICIRPFKRNKPSVTPNVRYLSSIQYFNMRRWHIVWQICTLYS